MWRSHPPDVFLPQNTVHHRLAEWAPWLPNDLRSIGKGVDRGIFVSDSVPIVESLEEVNVSGDACVGGL